MATTAIVAELHANVGLRIVPAGDVSVSRRTTRGRFKLGVFCRHRAGGHDDACAHTARTLVTWPRLQTPSAETWWHITSSWLFQPDCARAVSWWGAVGAFLASISRQVPPAIHQRPSREVSQRHVLASRTLLHRGSARITARTRERPRSMLARSS